MKNLTYIALVVLFLTLLQQGTRAVTCVETESAKLTVGDVDFGDVVCGTTDTVWITVQNNDAEDGEIRNVYLLDDAQGELQLLDQSMPIQLTEGASVGIGVMVTPVTPREVFVRCVFVQDDDGAASDTVSCRIHYRAIQKPPDSSGVIQFELHGDTVNVGDVFDLTLKCVSGADWLRAHQVRSISYRMTYRRTVLTINPVISDGTIQNAMRTVNVESTTSLASEIADTLNFTACLGDSDVSDVILTDIRIEVDTGEILVDTMISAVVKVIDKWASAEPRFVLRDTTMPALEVFPNPASAAPALSLHACSAGSTVNVYTLNGNFVYSWKSEITEGVRDVHISLPNIFVPGSYVCTYLSNHAEVSKIFFVLR